MEADDEQSLVPKATIAKFLKDHLPENFRCGNDARELVVQCATEFINLISSQANEVCNKHEKTKICADHLYEALQELGFQDFIGELKSIGEEITSGKKEKSSKKAAKKVSGKSDEQLRKEQEEKFALARSRTGSSLSTLAQNPESSENVFGDDDEDLDDIDDDDE